MKTGKEDRAGKKIASEIDDLFLRLTEILWIHTARSSGDKKRAPLNITEHFLIEYLGRESFASMSKLSQLIQVAPTTMTSMVDRLIKRGLLKRRRAQQDRRKVLVTLSEEGKRFYQEHRRSSLDIYTQFLATMPDQGEGFEGSLKEIINTIISFKKHLDKIMEINSEDITITDEQKK